MAWKHLGETFDIHGGGIDLVFPHHENEIAQSRCAFHTGVMANYWMHNGFLQVEGEKMAKSAGNFVTIRELLADWPGEVLRFNMLRTHYRQPIDWTNDSLVESGKILDRWYHSIEDEPVATDVDAEVLDALSDDLNTPRAITRLHAIQSEIRGPRHPLEKIKAKHSLVSSARALGILNRTKRDWFLVEKSLARNPSSASQLDPKRVEELVQARNAARKAKDFNESDRIRDELAAMGVRLKDNPDGTSTPELSR
jgi:cysteinyl-tRNA synthetase